MNQPTDPNTRKQTPRMPSNALYEKVVPIAIGLMVLILVLVIAAVVFAPLLGPGGY
jgi:hypothetical protein